MLRIQISNEMDNTIKARITIQEKMTLFGLYDGTVIFIFKSFFEMFRCSNSKNGSQLIS